jgi:hypothetical protein
MQIAIQSERIFRPVKIGPAFANITVTDYSSQTDYRTIRSLQGTA